MNHRQNALLAASVAACLVLLVSPTHADPTGFVPDSLADGGQPYAVTVPIDVSAPHTAAQSIYQHEVYGPDIIYDVPTPPPPPGKSYTVRLHFAELYDGAVGGRVFSVTLNGKRVLQNFDVFAEAGAKDKAVVKEFTGVTPNVEGNIKIEFAALSGHADANAAVNGIELLAVGFTPADLPPMPKNFPFQNSALPQNVRVDDLVSRLTLREKAAQMRFTAPAIPRLGIPAYNWWNEALHGVARSGIATVFPQAIGLAGTWDTDLHGRMASAISDEARAKYNDAVAHGNHGQYFGLDFWSPNINIFRDPRWGRGQETYGEDPYLTGRLGVAFIRGMQGDDPRVLKVVATAKHFAVHSGPESLRHVFDAQPSPYDLNDTYLPAFEAAVKEGHARSVMGAYNRVDGVPACASPFLLQQTLRDKWGFTGYVVSDCGAIGDIAYSHHYAKDAAEASADAVLAGCDLACDDAYAALTDAVKRGLLGPREIDRSVTRLFAARFALGLFDPPTPTGYDAIPLSVNDSPAHRMLAAQSARESIALLRNEGDALPLPKSLPSVAVIGPNADDANALLGNYNGDTSHAVTILEGLRKKLGPGAAVGYAQGCDVKGDSRDGFPAALALAQKSDVVIAVLGLNQSVEGEEGGGGDRTSLDLPGRQEELLEALVATGKPVVLVLLNGSALSLNWASRHIPAIVEAWYPGEEGGTAVADVLFGDYNPAGRLPVTFYKSAADLPEFTDYAMRARTYRYFEGAPLYPFGWGLSYTHFAYTRLQMPTHARSGRPVTIMATVRNAGTRAGDEVVELYLRPSPGAPTRTTGPGQPMPRLILAGFRRLLLAPGQSRTVSLTLRPEQLRLVNAQGVRTIQPGAWEVYIGGSQPDPAVPGAGLRGLLTVQ